MSLPSCLVLLGIQDLVRRKDSINPVNAQYFHADSASTLVESVVSAMRRLPPDGPSPALVAESSLAAQSLKLALAGATWPGRDAGAPMPWCGTLDQAVEQLITAAAVIEPDQGIDFAAGPRAVAVRRAQLAQQLLDRPGLRESLGGSARAALGLASQWIELFEGWEWLEAGRVKNASQMKGSSVLSGETNQEVSTLRLLHDQNRSLRDTTAFVMRLRQHPQWLQVSQQLFSGHPFFQANQVWFCLARTPTPQEMAIAQSVWSLPPEKISIWRLSAPTLPTDEPRRLISAQTLEETAWVAAQTILEWRRSGIDDIGVVALDRKAVRRLRALLERAGEPFNDRSGWALDTTVAASAVTGLAEMLTGRATTQSVLEWIHGPFVATALEKVFDFGFEQRRSTDRALREFGRIAPISFATLRDACGFPVDQDRGVAPRPRQAIRVWAAQLLSALQFYGVDQRLSEDAAGAAVLSALQRLAEESTQDEAEISATLWHALLAEELSRGRFSESTPDAMVRICSIGSLIWRPPKAVMLVGADPSRFPERMTARFFEPKRFAEMGLALDPDQEEAELYARFQLIWSTPIPLVAIAQSESSDAQAEFSRWIALAAQQGSAPVERVSASEVIARFSVIDAADMPALSQGHDFESPVWPYALPSSLSVSALQEIKNCPYQFFAGRLLRLDQVSDLTEEIAPSDVGSCLHLLLSRAPNRRQSKEDWLNWCHEELHQLLAGDRQSIFSNPTALTQDLRTQVLAHLPSIAQWLSERPEGRVQTERSVERELADLKIRIKGRIDRWETSDDGQAVLIDFKTTDPKTLEKRLRDEDRDLQLAAYAWLIGADQPVQDARYVALRRDGVTEIGLLSETAESVMDQAERQISEVTHRLIALRDQSPISRDGLHAGAEVCDYCAMRGVCRRDELLFASGDDDIDEDSA